MKFFNWRTFSLFFIFSLCTTAITSQGIDHNHKVFDGLLKKYVSNGLVSYQGFASEESSFKAYLDSLSNVTESEFNSFSEKEKLSFYINAYNAFTIQLILDHYPIASITDIGSPISTLNLVRGTPWKKDFFTLLGKKRTLDWIEHQKLRKDFAEPRIHFAIVCASIGCPHLVPYAYTPKDLENQLQSAKLNFLKNPKKNYYDSKKNILYLSQIFNWFQGDFTKKGTLIDFVQEGFSESIDPKAEIKYLDYSWSLNERK